MRHKKNEGNQLTQAQVNSYVENNGLNCPFCSKDNIVLETWDLLGAAHQGQVKQTVCCESCGESWEEIYSLTGIST